MLFYPFLAVHPSLGVGEYAACDPSYEFLITTSLNSVVITMSKLRFVAPLSHLCLSQLELLVLNIHICFIFPVFSLIPQAWWIHLTMTSILDYLKLFNDRVTVLSISHPGHFPFIYCFLFALIINSKVAGHWIFRLPQGEIIGKTWDFKSIVDLKLAVTVQ